MQGNAAQSKMTLVSFLIASLTMDFKVHLVQFQVQSIDSALLSLCFYHQRGQRFRRDWPQKDIHIESKTSLGFVQSLLSILLREQTLRLICFVDVVTVKVK